jgi:hypothetical protein
MTTYTLKIQIRGEKSYDLVNITAKTQKAAIEKLWERLDQIDDGFYAGMSSQAILIESFV